MTKQLQKNVKRSRVNGGFSSSLVSPLLTSVMLTFCLLNHYVKRKIYQYSTHDILSHFHYKGICTEFFHKPPFLHIAIYLNNTCYCSTSALLMLLGFLLFWSSFQFCESYYIFFLIHHFIDTNWLIQGSLFSYINVKYMFWEKRQDKIWNVMIYSV